MANYPATLPSPTFDGYALDPLDQTARTDMEAGQPRSRRRTKARDDKINVSWIFTDEQMALFRAWYDYDRGAGGGAAWFTIALAYGDFGIKQTEARFAGMWKAVPFPGLRWSVTAQLAIRGAAMTQDQILGAVLGLVYEKQYPSFVLDFDGIEPIHPMIACTRTGVATRINASGFVESVPAHTLRIDYNPTTLACMGALFEGTRSNRMLYSQDYSTGWTLTNTTVAGSAVLSPDGINFASQITHTVGGGAISQSPAITAGSIQTLTFYAKQGAARYARAEIGGLVSCWFDLQTGVVATNGTGSGNVTFVEKSIQKMPNGWYRCRLTVSTITITPLPVSISATATDGNGSLAANSIYLWGVQIEQNTYPSSYIPTTSALVSRNIDTVTVQGSAFSSWYNSAEGTTLAIADMVFVGGNQGYIYQTDNGTTNERMMLRNNAASTMNYIGVAAGTTVFSTAGGSITKDVQFKSAGAYAVNNFAQSTNGGAPLTDTAGALPLPATRIVIGGANSVMLDGHIRRLAYWPKRLSNATLQAMTA